MSNKNRLKSIRRKKAMKEFFDNYFNIEIEDIKKIQWKKYMRKEL